MVEGGLKDLPMSLMDFVDWFGCKGKDFFCFPSTSFLPCGVLVYVSCRNE